MSDDQPDFPRSQHYIPDADLIAAYMRGFRSKGRNIAPKLDGKALVHRLRSVYANEAGAERLGQQDADAEP